MAEAEGSVIAADLGVEVEVLGELDADEEADFDSEAGFAEETEGEAFGAAAVGFVGGFVFEEIGAGVDWVFEGNGDGTGKEEDNARIRVQGMFAFGACGPPGTPISLLGLGGQLEMTGEINVAGVTIHQGRTLLETTK